MGTTEALWIAAVAGCFSACSLACSLWVVVRYDPLAVFRRLEEVEREIPSAKQALNAWTVETETMLEACEVRLRKAHDRKGGRPKKEDAPAPAAPVALDPAASRRQQLELVKRQFGQA